MLLIRIRKRVDFKSTDPVRRYIESQFDDTTNLSQAINNSLIAKLPDPLYVLYSLVLAYQQCDGMEENSDDIMFLFSDIIIIREKNTLQNSSVIILYFENFD